MLGLPRRANVVERDVLLRCDETAVVYAPTVLPVSATASQWPVFVSLGNTLYDDTQVTRGDLHCARLRASHPLMRQIRGLHLVSAQMHRLFARRYLFTRRGFSRLVTEIFSSTLSYKAL